MAAFLTLAAGLSGMAFGALRRPRLSELQLSGDPMRVKGVVQGDPQRVRRLEQQLLTDYGFIACYWLTFVGLAIAIARRGGAAYDVAGLLAVVATSATALLDVVENVRTRGLLALDRPSDQVRRQPVVHLRRTALAKWAASAVTLALLAVLFLPGHGLVLVLGAVFLAVAGLGLLAVLWNRLIALYLLGFLVLGGVVAVAFTIVPRDVLDRL